MEEIMGKKMVIVFALFMLIFITGCNNEHEEHDFDLSGEYIYGDCVYIYMLSSSTKEYETELYKDLYYFDFSNDTLLYYSDEDELIDTYEEVDYRSVDKDLYVDDVFNFGINEFLDLVEYRFDIYRNDQIIGFTIFQSDTQTYIADTRMLGGSGDIFTIWSIFELIEN